MTPSPDDTLAAPTDTESRPTLFTRLLEIFTEGFIDTFGITHPKPQEEKRAAYFIVGTLVISIAVIVLVFLLVIKHL